jgi:type II secretory pathway component PulF
VIIMCLAGVVVVILAAVLSPMLSLYTGLDESL